MILLATDAVTTHYFMTFSKKATSDPSSIHKSLYILLHLSNELLFMES